jgi:uncharacterized membrane protein YdbT with pleckstrin-like domain
MDNLPISKHHIRLNVFLLVIRVFAVLFLANTAYGIVLYLIKDSDFLQDLGLALWVGHIILFLVETFIVLQFVAIWATTNYYLTDKELIVTKGILVERDLSNELHAVRDVELRQSWLGKKLNYGDVVVTFSASGGYHKDVILDGIKNPREYERIVRSYVNQ